MDIDKVSGTSPYNLGAALRGVLPVQAARGYKLLAEVSWASAFGAAVLEAVMVETRDGKTNAPNLAVAP
jgi:hypothetical protein